MMKWFVVGHTIQLRNWSGREELPSTLLRTIVPTLSLI